MIGLVILANAAVILAFFGGVTADLPIKRSERRTKLFTLLALAALVTLTTLIMTRERASIAVEGEMSAMGH